MGGYMGHSYFLGTVYFLIPGQITKCETCINKRKRVLYLRSYFKALIFCNLRRVLKLCFLFRESSTRSEHTQRIHSHTTTNARISMNKTAKRGKETTFHTYKYHGKFHKKKRLWCLIMANNESASQ